MDENYEEEVRVEMGCYECSDIVYVHPFESKCPRCGSTSIHTMQEVLETALEHRRQMSDLGLDSYEDE